MIIILMSFVDYSGANREYILNGILTMVSCHLSVGSIGSHRGLFLSSSIYHDALSMICKDVRDGLNIRGAKDIKVIPICIGKDNLDEKLRVNGWTGIVAIDVDSYFQDASLRAA